MITKTASTVDEFRTVVDELEKSYNKALKTTTDRDLSQVENELTTMFKAVQWNLYTLARALKGKLNSHRADIVAGRVPVEKPVENSTVEEKKPAKKGKKK